MHRGIRREQRLENRLDRRNLEPVFWLREDEPGLRQLLRPPACQADGGQPEQSDAGRLSGLGDPRPGRQQRSGGLGLR